MQHIRQTLVTFSTDLHLLMRHLTAGGREAVVPVKTIDGEGLGG